MSSHGFQRFVLVVLLLMTVTPTAFAAARARPGVAAKTCAAPGPNVLVASWSIGKFIGPGGRSRVVQVCVVVMCLALFIMMRKLN
jgi:hypothetical protein